ncbi:DNA replication complex subunit Gins51 [Natronorubrum daqingense]|uniref:DNA replication factor GINS n=1 Tax=Natronorubrum daqingense TaxID=588898 RepID=A0A1N7EBA3_9EURY|nr:hypothetical protein [Natronorubrum daqingense]APX96468.1 hypothetical protein BB347_07475 [Natronorubrum daqingense]SIR85344.1 DNA replication factor GINS [Natronorubrum daqingense]
MNLDELRSVQSKERQKDSLQNLRPSFYQEVGEYIADLEDERDRVAEQADDPFSSPEVGRLTDEIETAKDVVEAIYERRMGKLVKQASLAAAGMPANDEGLTAEEVDLFDDLVERISSNKSRVLDVLEGVDIGSPASTASDSSTSAAGDGSPDTSDPARSDSSAADHAVPEDPGDDAPPVATQDSPAASTDDESPRVANADGDESGVTPADVMGADGPTAHDEATSQPSAETEAERDSDGSMTPNEDESSPVERVTVKITRDIGQILGVDEREYSLSTDDIVTLPEQNATPLLEQEAAESLE